MRTAAARPVMCHYGLDDEKMKIVPSLDESRTLFEN
jgi:hypothetical protein